MTWALLVVAGLFEVVWAIGLKYTNGFTKLTPSLITIGAMIISFLLLAHVMKTLPVGIAYVSWVGIGAIGAAVFGVFLFNEPVNAGRVISMFFIVAGVVGLKLSTNS